MDNVWNYLIERPIGEEITKRFKNDDVRGIVATDAIIGTFASTSNIQSNICFLYHVIGNGSGEWKVPEGGMGALVKELERVALSQKVTIKVNSKVKNIESDNKGVRVTLEDATYFSAKYLLSNAAP